MIPLDIGEAELPPVVHFDENVFICFDEVRVDKLVIYTLVVCLSDMLSWSKGNSTLRTFTLAGNTNATPNSSPDQ